jgi:hypothetical protein
MSNGRPQEWCFGKESVIKAIEAVGRGELVVVVDDESRENEGDLIMVRPTSPFFQAKIHEAGRFVGMPPVGAVRRPEPADGYVTLPR